MFIEIVLVNLIAGVSAAELHVRPIDGPAGTTVTVAEGGRPVFSPVDDAAALSVVQPDARTPVAYGHCSEQDGALTMTGGSAPGLELSEEWRRVTPALWDRVRLVADGCCYLWPGRPGEGLYYSFLDESRPQGRTARAARARGSATTSGRHFRCWVSVLATGSTALSATVPVCGKTAAF